MPQAALGPALSVQIVKVVVGYSAGGAVDTASRAVGQAMSVTMGQPFVVDNKPGGGTNIAVKSVIAAEPDGYTLMLASNALAANMALYQPAPFDAERDLVPVSLIGRVAVVTSATASAPYASVKQQIAAAKAKPRSISFARPGRATARRRIWRWSFSNARRVSLCCTLPTPGLAGHHRCDWRPTGTDGR